MGKMILPMPGTVGFHKGLVELDTMEIECVFPEAPSCRFVVVSVEVDVKDGLCIGVVISAHPINEEPQGHGI